MNLTVIDPIAGALGAWASSLSLASIIFRTVISVVFASVIGCERSIKRHAAGLRTFIIISLAGTTAMLIDLFLMLTASVGFPVITAAAVVGAAMISGNSILFSSRNEIKGLTTSAGLWGTAVIGVSAGAGLYTVTLVVFIALLCIVSFLPPFEKYLKDRSNHFEIHLELKSNSNLRDFTATVRKLGMQIDDIEANPAYTSSGLSVYSVFLTINSKELKKYKTHSEIITALSSLDYIYHIEEMN